MEYTWFSHFSGCGGSTLGAIQAGFKPLLAIENDAKIADLYRQNIASNLLELDISSITLPQILNNLPTGGECERTKEILIMQTSPPCQEFSQANMKRDSTTERANILQETFWQYDLLRPEYIILENVKAYAASDSLREFENLLLGMNYSIWKAVLNSADFGVPQTRERLILIATKQGYPTPDIATTHAINPSNQLSLFESLKQQWVSWYVAIKDLIPALDIVKPSKSQRELGFPNNSLVERVGWFTKPKYRIANRPCWTLRASLGDDGKAGRSKVIDVYGEEIVRTLNTQALARLQSFPDSYRWGESFKINMQGIGNSVPPLLMKHICDAIKTACEHKQTLC